MSNKCDVFERNESYVSELDFKKTLHKHAMMISEEFAFLSPLISFLSIGNAYFSFILLLFSIFYSLFRNTM